MPPSPASPGFVSPAPPTLYFDLASPYAYLAFERAPAVLGVTPEYHPVLLGAIFRWRGFGTWAATPEREPRMAEIEERARRYGLPPIVWPANWPANSLTAMRAAVWAGSEGAMERFAHATFHRQFGGGADITDPEVLRASAADAGVDGTAMLEAVGDTAVKDALRRNTERAWADGVRGIPSLRIGATVFYGDDQLPLAAALLAA